MEWRMPVWRWCWGCWFSGSVSLGSLQQHQRNPLTTDRHLGLLLQPDMSQTHRKWGNAGLFSLAGLRSFFFFSFTLSFSLSHFLIHSLGLVFLSFPHFLSLYLSLPLPLFFLTSLIIIRTYMSFPYFFSLIPSLFISTLPPIPLSCFSIFSLSLSFFLSIPLSSSPLVDFYPLSDGSFISHNESIRVGANAPPVERRGERGARPTCDPAGVSYRWASFTDTLGGQGELNATHLWSAA